MDTRRIAIALVLAAWASEAVAGGRSASFSVSVMVVAPLRSRAIPTQPPASYVVSQGRTSIPCGVAASPACAEAVAAAARAAGGPVVLTSFTDGSPGAVVER